MSVPCRSKWTVCSTTLMDTHFVGATRGARYQERPSTTILGSEPVPIQVGE